MAKKQEKMAATVALNANQVGVVAFRRQQDGWATCLITNRKGRWGIPKGNLAAGEVSMEGALREAYEEAGLRGRIISPPFTVFEYRKAKRLRRVATYLMLADECHDRWPEMSFRDRLWIRPQEAGSWVARAAVLTTLQQAEIHLERLQTRSRPILFHMGDRIPSFAATTPS